MSKKFDLNGNWNFREYPLTARRMRDLESGQWLDTTVPCSIFTSLTGAGKINKAEMLSNPENFSWVSEKPWVFRKEFAVPTELFDCDRVDLIFEGLDTVASIWLNGKLIARTDNMFIEYRFDVTELLSKSNNTLIVKFESALSYSKNLMERYTTFTEEDFSNPHRVYLRKAQYQFGWDFCPPMAGCGIFRAVRLEGINTARMTDVQIVTIDCNEKFADIKVACSIDAVKKADYLCRLKITGHGQNIEGQLNFDTNERSHSTVIRIEEPALWWPRGYGQASLYDLKMEIVKNEKTLDSIEKKIGIRTVKLDQTEDDYGENFRFIVNGRAVFAKGANWVPPSVLAGTVTSDDIAELIDSAARANMNIIRVWAGGYYESDEFYKICDEKGIMVWQDFMFACAYYPDQQWFLEQIRAEAISIIKKLRNHCSIILWCGNNEIQWLHNLGRLGKNRKFYGESIFDKLLPQLVTEYDSERDYISTTPLYAKKNRKGQVFTAFHQWNVWSDNKPVNDYLYPASSLPRFVTEFGMQSLPDLNSLRKFCPDQAMKVGSRGLEKHNYQLYGNSYLFRYIGDLFGSPKDIRQLVYFSQLTQARGIKMHVEHLRVNNRQNNGMMFWQLADCAPAISWSAIDFLKNPKALYYYATRFYAEQLVAVAANLKSLGVVVVNQSTNLVTGNVECTLRKLSGQVLDRMEVPVSLGPFTNSTVLKLPQNMSEPALPNQCVLYVSLQSNDNVIADNSFFYLPDKYIDFPEVQITKSINQIEQGKFRLKLSSNAITKDVQIIPPVEAQLSDNFFDLTPNAEREITITCKDDDTLNADDIQLFSVNHAYR